MAKTEWIIEADHGRRKNQRLKPYLVLQILMKHTDEDHVMSADQIVAELSEMGIDAERRSIYPDIDEINKVLYMLDQGCTMEEAEADLYRDRGYRDSTGQGTVPCPA